MKNRLAVFLTLICIMCVTAAASALSIGANDVDLSFLSFDPDLYYGRGELAKMENGDNLVKLYNIVVESIEKGEPETVINTTYSVNDIEITLEELNTVLCAYRYDNPQHFWLDYFQYRPFSYKGATYVYSVVFNYLPHFDINTAKAEFEEAADAFLIKARVNSSMSQYEIAKRLHDAVARQIEYTAGKPNSHNAYGALIEGEAVCEGYAELYQYALYKMGIQSHIITGDAGGPHAWNLVNIDGEYYQTDVTWDDQGDTVYYDYLNTTSARMLEERIIDDNGYPIPECTSTDANFFYRGEGAVFEQTPDYRDAVAQLRNGAIARFYYEGTEEYDLGQFYRWFEAYRALINNELNIRGTYSVSVLNREYIIINSSYVSEEVKGDADGDGGVSADDAIYLLYSVLFGQGQYPVKGLCDYDGSGSVSADDAIYLLYSVLFGQADYPLH